MKRIYLLLPGLLLMFVSAIGQSYLTPALGYQARDIFPGYTNFQAIDIYDTLLYGTDGDTIHCLDIESSVSLTDIHRFRVFWLFLLAGKSYGPGIR